VRERDLLVGKKRAGQQPLGGLLGLADRLSLPCARFLFSLRRTVLHGAGCRAEFTQGSGELVAHLADRDDRTQDALALAKEIDDLGLRGAGVHARPIGNDRDLGPVVGEVLAHVVDRLAHLLEAGACIGQPADDLQLEEVVERVQPLGPRPLRRLDRGRDETRASPVIELAVSDVDDLASLWSAISDLGLLHC
jgi:hypothetical protein